jgi:hypothetical protein
VAAFLVLCGAFFPRYGVSLLLGIAVLSEGFSVCHACYQFLTGVPLVGLGFGEILEVVKLLRETLVHTLVGSDWSLRPGRFDGGGAPLSRLLGTSMCWVYLLL